jgi:hypothetical protein
MSGSRLHPGAASKSLARVKFGPYFLCATGFKTGAQGEGKLIPPPETPDRNRSLETISIGRRGPGTGSPPVRRGITHIAARRSLLVTVVICPCVSFITSTFTCRAPPTTTRSRRTRFQVPMLPRLSRVPCIRVIPMHDGSVSS